jgi:hypothetical protein
MFARMFSSFLFNWRKEADDRKAPGGVPAFPYFLALYVLYRNR